MIPCALPLAASDGVIISGVHNPSTLSIYLEEQVYLYNQRGEIDISAWPFRGVYTISSVYAFFSLFSLYVGCLLKCVVQLRALNFVNLLISGLLVMIFIIINKLYYYR